MATRLATLVAALFFAVASSVEHCVDSAAKARGGASLLQREAGTKDIVMLTGDTEAPEDQPEDIASALASDAEVPKAFGTTYPQLAAALPLVIINMTNYSGLTGSHSNIGHVFGDREKDAALLFEMVEGYMLVLHESLPAGDGEKYCPFNNISVIKRCIDMAACLLQKDVGTGNFTMANYALYEETLARFDDIGWGLIEELFLIEDLDVVGLSLTVPEAYECDGTYNDDESALYNATRDEINNASLIQAGAATHAFRVAMGVSAALERANRATHDILDSHRMNSSVDATVAELHRTWLPACKLMLCDHTNYYDMFGASHSHSLALIEAGASARHLRTQVRSRLKLENRMQRFLAEHGEHLIERIYRAERTQVVEQMGEYLAQGRASMSHYVLGYLSSLEEDKLLRLVNRDRLKEFLIRIGKADLLEAHETPELVEEAEEDLVEEAEEGPTQEVNLVELQGRRRRRRRRFWRRRSSVLKAVSNVANNVADAVTSVVSAVVSFIADTFECFGQAKTLVAKGYCKKFFGLTPPAFPGVGVGFGYAAGLSDLLSGKFVPGLGLFMSMVVGSVPFSPQTGGLRTGVGIGGSIACSTTSCNVGISVGSVASALIPTPACEVGSYLAGFKCMTAAGATVSVLCCSFDLTAGTDNCR